MISDSKTAAGSESVQTPSQSVEGAIDDVRAEGRRLAVEAKQGIAGLADERKRATVSYIQVLASAVGTGAEELERKGQGATASYAVAAADELNRLADRLSGRDPVQLVRDLEDFGRRRPALFFGAALVTGIGLTRFLRSSAARGQPDTSFSGSASPASTDPESPNRGGYS